MNVVSVSLAVCGAVCLKMFHSLRSCICKASPFYFSVHTSHLGKHLSLLLLLLRQVLKTSVKQRTLLFKLKFFFNFRSLELWAHTQPSELSSVCPFHSKQGEEISQRCKELPSGHSAHGWCKPLLFCLFKLVWAFWADVSGQFSLWRGGCPNSIDTLLISIPSALDHFWGAKKQFSGKNGGVGQISLKCAHWEHDINM